MCVCVCVCLNERKRERGERERKRVCACTLTLLSGRFNPLEVVMLQCYWGVCENPSGSIVADPIIYAGQINKTVLREKVKTEASTLHRLSK